MTFAQSQQPVKIRSMRADDVDRVLAIAAAAPHAPHWPRSAYLTALNPQAAPPRIALVAVDPAEATISGFVVASLVPPGAELETIAVAADRQRMGLGRELLKEIFHALKRSGVHEMWLEVRPSNQSAIALYRHAGFVENGVRNSYYTEPIEDATVMKLTIG